MPTTIPILLRLIWNHPANRGKRIRAVAKAIAWQAYKRTMTRPFRLRIYRDVILNAYPDSEESGRFIYFNGLPDQREMVFMRRYMRPGDRFIDGGAHIGTYTLLAASLVGTKGSVDAFEPAPVEARRLIENIDLNRLSNVRVHLVALADKRGFAQFTIDRGAGNRIKTVDDADRAVRTVRTTTLDEALTGRYAMAKLDLEGAEFLALKGAEEHLIEGNPPVWLLELVNRFVRRFGASALDVVDWLAARGYELARYDVARNRLYARRCLSSEPNVLMVHRPALAAVEARLAGAVETPTLSS
jgi:FkbM family methyltransferase